MSWVILAVWGGIERKKAFGWGAQTVSEVRKLSILLPSSSSFNRNGNRLGVCREAMKKMKERKRDYDSQKNQRICCEMIDPRSIPSGIGMNSCGQRCVLQQRPYLPLPKISSTTFMWLDWSMRRNIPYYNWWCTAYGHAAFSVEMWRFSAHLSIQPEEPVNIFENLTVNLPYQSFKVQIFNISDGVHCS